MMVAEQAYQSALQNLSKLLSGTNVQISTYLERETGLQRITINDGDTGKRIIDYPPSAVVEIADRARQQQIGWLIDVVA